MSESSFAAPTGLGTSDQNHTTMKTEQPQTPNTEKDSKYWDAFALWWTPRNGGGQPDRNDAATWEKYQYYCAGVMDERSPDVPNS
jgi:hypothetical protein